MNILHPLKIANFLNYKFSKLGDFIGTQSPFKGLAADTRKRKSIFKFRFVTSGECFAVLKSLNSKKPLGPSEIPAWALKDGAHYLAPQLTYIINDFIRQNRFPQRLKLAIVTPVFKKDDPEDPENYRPISVTGALSKVFERLLSDQINDYLHAQKIYSRTQFGFRSKHSTIDALLYCTESFRKIMGDRKIAAAALLDLSKAFDSINHKTLRTKLNDLNFDISAINLIYDFISERQQCTNINDVKSEWIKLYQGVPQGTILGPLLFNLYINDLRSIIPVNCEVVQYADDTLLFTQHENCHRATNQLQQSINIIQQYFDSLSLNLNEKKLSLLFSRLDVTTMKRKCVNYQ